MKSTIKKYNIPIGIISFVGIIALLLFGVVIGRKLAFLKISTPPIKSQAEINDNDRDSGNNLPPGVDCDKYDVIKAEIGKVYTARDNDTDSEGRTQMGFDCKVQVNRIGDYTGDTPTGCFAHYNGSDHSISNTRCFKFISYNDAIATYTFRCYPEKDVTDFINDLSISPDKGPCGPANYIPQIPTPLYTPIQIPPIHSSVTPTTPANPPPVVLDTPIPTATVPPLVVINTPIPSPTIPSRTGNGSIKINLNLNAKSSMFEDSAHFLKFTLYEVKEDSSSIVGDPVYFDAAKYFDRTNPITSFSLPDLRPGQYFVELDTLYLYSKPGSIGFSYEGAPEMFTSAPKCSLANHTDRNCFIQVISSEQTPKSITITIIDG